MINVSDLVFAHEATTINRHKRLLEDLFYLCVNKSFNKTIDAFRKELSAKLNEVKIPNSKEKSIELRDQIMREDDGWFIDSLHQIANKHHYHHPSFVRNYWAIGTDAETQNRFNILENVIFLNSPILKEDTREHFGTRSGYMEIADDDPEGPYIKIAFDIGTSKKNIVDIIDKEYPEISAKMQEDYRIPDIKFTPDDRLLEKQRIFELHNKGKADAHIGVRLKKEGLSDSELTEEAINSIRRRSGSKINRFDP